ncbi:ATP-binding cassette domain-containing protein, partial [Acinetobacter baumannii]
SGDIVLANVEKRFPTMSRPAVTELSATIVAGRITGLVGPDGAGKTTLLRMLAGLMLPSAGSIQLGRLDPVRDATRLRSELG